MVIVGVGVDAVSIPRFQNLIKKYGIKFIKKLFHTREIEQQPQLPELLPQYYASRWAVKEATVKAIGKSGLSSKSMFVWKKDGVKLSAPQLHIEGEALHHLNLKLGGMGAMQQQNEGKEINVNDEPFHRWNAHVSLSHETDLAIAFVVLEKI